MADGKEKHDIRDEIERQLKDPPTSFSDWIDKKVEERVEKRDKFYRTIAYITVGCFSIVAWVWLHATFKDIGEKVNQALSEKEVVEASKMILTLKGEVETNSQRIADLSKSSQQESRIFSNRLAQLKQQDNIIASEDLPTLWITQVVTNLIDGNKIVLDFDPIPQTVLMRRHLQSSSTGVWRQQGILDGRTITITNETALSSISRSLTNPISLYQVEYFRASKFH